MTDVRFINIHHDEPDVLICSDIIHSLQALPFENNAVQKKAPKVIQKRMSGVAAKISEVGFTSVEPFNLCFSTCVQRYTGTQTHSTIYT